MGFGELGRGEPELHQVTVGPDSVDYFSEQLALGNSQTLMGGRDTLTEARILISIDGLDSITVFDSVKLMLHRYPTDQIDQDPMRFSLYPLTAEWEEAGCTWVKADVSTKWYDLGGEYDSTQLIAELDVDQDTVELLLDPELLEAYNTGFIMLPRDDGFCYLASTESADSIKPRVFGFLGVDTTVFEPQAGTEYRAEVFDAAILKPYQAPSPDTLIGAGLAWRTYVHFPVAESIPYKVDITSAELVVRYQNFFSPESVLTFVCYRLTEDYVGRLSEVSSSVWGRDSLRRDEDSLGVSLIGLTQLWVDEPDTNLGFILSYTYYPASPSYSQERRIYALGRIVGPPKLVITYAELPEGRFPGEE